MEELSECDIVDLIKDHRTYRNLAASSYQHTPYFTFRAYHMALVDILNHKIYLLEEALTKLRAGKSVTKSDLIEVFS